LKKITVLGSTGSIGTQTLDVIDNLGYEILGMSCFNNLDLFYEQIIKYRPKYVAVKDFDSVKYLKSLSGTNDIEFFTGDDGLNTLASIKCDMTIVAIVGIAAFLPLMNAINAGNNIGIANKEAIVTAGEIIMPAVREKKIHFIPVDSEHSAVFQCINADKYNKIEDNNKNINKIILTASGGPFFGMTSEQLENVTKEQASVHPTWKMGPKITVDCATLMNKGLEIIEAVRLFDLPEKQISVVIHRESVIHSLVEFTDNSQIAQLSCPDMRLAIQYALTYPERRKSPVKSLNLCDYGKLSFFEPDIHTFKLLELCRQSVRSGGTMPTVINAANEVCVDSFLSGKIKFTDIFNITEEILNQSKLQKITDIGTILETDKKTRLDTQKLLNKIITN